MQIHPLAQALNSTLQSGNDIAYALLSRKGREIFFPSKGILGQSAEARGKEINATIGTALEDDGSPLTLGCLEEMVSTPKSAFLYAPSFGNPELRDRWKEMLAQKNPSLAQKRFSTPVVSAALTHALSVAGYLFVDDEAEMILPDLYWDNYDLIFGHGFGARFSLYNTFADGGFDVKALEGAVAKSNASKKIILLNFPNNPTGYTPTDAEAAEIVRTLTALSAQGHKMTVLLDDAYFGLVYEDGITRESLFGSLCDAHENLLAVKMDGPTKEDYVWGFRVGFMTFGFKGATDEQFKALEAKAAGIVRGTLSNVPNISQALLLAAYNTEVYSKQKNAKYDTLKKRYIKITNILSAHTEYEQSFTAMPFNSGYFMCVKLKNADPESVRRLLLEKYSTGVIVLAGLVRLAFSAVPYNKLEALFDNLHMAVQEVQSK